MFNKKNELSASFSGELTVSHKRNLDKCWQVVIPSKKSIPNHRSVKGFRAYLEGELNASEIALPLVNAILCEDIVTVRDFKDAGVNLNCFISKANFPTKVESVRDGVSFRVTYVRSETCYNSHSPGECAYDTKLVGWGKEKTQTFSSLIGQKYTPLHIAVVVGNKKILTDLVDAGASLTFKDSFGQTAIHLAYLLKAYDLIPVLLTGCKGGDIDIKNGKNNTILHLAVSAGQSGVVRQLVEAGASLRPKDSSEKTALHLACSSNKYELIPVLLKEVKEGDIELKNSKGQTVLHLTAHAGKLDIVKQVLTLHAKVDSESNTGKTPLYYASETGHLSTITHLINSGADVHKTDSEGVTPLCHALSVNKTQQKHDVVKLLLSNGANPYHRTSIGDNSIELAIKNNEISILRLLLTSSFDYSSTEKKEVYEAAYNVAESEKNVDAMLEIITYLEGDIFASKVIEILDAAVTSGDVDVVNKCIDTMRDSSILVPRNTIKRTVLAHRHDEAKHLALLDCVFRISGESITVGNEKGVLITAVTELSSPRNLAICRFLIAQAVRDDNHEMLDISYSGKHTSYYLKTHCNVALHRLFVKAYGALSESMTAAHVAKYKFNETDWEDISENGSVVQAVESAFSGEKEVELKPVDGSTGSTDSPPYLGQITDENL